MTSFFSAEVVASASKLRYAGRGRGKESPVHPEFLHLCALVDTHGRNYAQKLIKKIEEVSSLIADSLSAQEYDEHFGFVGLRNGLISAFANMFPDEIEKFSWDIQSVLHKLNFAPQAIQETLDNRFRPEPWHAWMSSLGRSRSSVRPWRQKGVNNKDADDSAWFLDAEVIIAKLAATRESGELSGHTTLRVVRYTDFGQSWEILHEEKNYMWSNYGEKPVSTELPMTDYGQAWVDWIGRKTDIMPRV